MDVKKVYRLWEEYPRLCVVAPSRSGKTFAIARIAERLVKIPFSSIIYAAHPRHYLLNVFIDEPLVQVVGEKDDPKFLSVTDPSFEVPLFLDDIALCGVNSHRRRFGNFEKVLHMTSVFNADLSCLFDKVILMEMRDVE